MVFAPPGSWRGDEARGGGGAHGGGPRDDGSGERSPGDSLSGNEACDGDGGGGGGGGRRPGPRSSGGSHDGDGDRERRPGSNLCGDGASNGCGLRSRGLGGSRRGGGGPGQHAHDGGARGGCSDGRQRQRGRGGDRCRHNKRRQGSEARGGDPGQRVSCDGLGQRGEQQRGNEASGDGASGGVVVWRRPAVAKAGAPAAVASWCSRPASGSARGKGCRRRRESQIQRCDGRIQWREGWIRCTGWRRSSYSRRRRGEGREGGEGVRKRRPVMAGDDGGRVAGGGRRQAIFSATVDVHSEAYAYNPNLNQVTEGYFGVPKHHANQSPFLLTSDLDSQSKQLASSLVKTPPNGNIPNDVPARQNSLGLWKYFEDDSPLLGDNQSSAIPTSQPMTNDRIFRITEISPEWAYCTENTKVLVVGHFHEQYRNVTVTNLHCVIGDKCVAADTVQSGVYRFVATPHTPGRVNLYLTLDGKTPISEVLSFDYRTVPGRSLESELSSVDDEPNKSKLQMQMRLARLLFSANKKKLAPKFLVEGSKVSNLLSASTEKEWMDLMKFVTDSKGPCVAATEGLLELVLRNRLQEWLAEKIVEGHKSTGRDDLGQGPIHLCSFLGYTWAIRLFSLSGFSLDFRDSSGWTALHWAAYFGREKMVAALLSAGANPSLVTDPTPEAPGGYTAADLAARGGYDGLAAYLAEKGLTAHFEAMSLSKDTGRSPFRTKSIKQPKEIETLSEQELCLRESLAAYRNAADAANNIQAALRERTLKLRSKEIQLANPEAEAAAIVAAMRIQHAFRNYNRKKVMRAAARIQSHYRTWKTRRDFMNMRRQVIKIQAAYRGHRERRQYRKVIWSVGVVEKAILRWRKKRKGLRGIATGMAVAMTTDAEPASTAEEDYFQIGRQQAEDRFNRSVVRVQALFRSYRAQQEYRRMKVAHEEAKVQILSFKCSYY
ncbi:hypothetical protein PR202_gb20835 [Eleusine coracana subsp. coracana]|uniref:Calmodulin-binding transcription activator 5 n=1 Tax=Eleusine coracana subsp. coracana TaxID=191504 RepID=A0AAV5FD80_ELECO|nr:hypothetical protein PR202_gb20835 [Eleusine coracana subsp. coracana]